MTISASVDPGSQRPTVPSTATLMTHTLNYYGRPMEWADHYIFALWFLLFIYLSIFLFFPCLISAVADWMSAILHTWCGGLWP